MEIQMKKLLLMVLLINICVMISSQSAKAETKYTTKQNIPYYDDAVNQSDEYIRRRCVLDIYYPQDVKQFATVVWFHGGGLTAGKKHISSALKDKGLCVVAVNYRLSPKVKAAKCIEDSAAAVAWVFKNIHKYGGDPELIFVSGHSAGGYLTSMVGLDKRWLKAQGIDANKIAGLIPFSGHTITHFTVRKERGIKSTRPIIDDMAPLYHVRPDVSPLLLITGDRELEMLGRYEENAYLMRMMKVVGHKDTRLFELDGYGHGMADPAFPLLLREVKRIAKKKSK